MTYEDWYDKIGQGIEDDIREWFDSVPDTICMSELLDTDIDTFVNQALEHEYESDESENVDRLYEEYKERDI